ncbi:MAG: hypothetical protein JNK05_10160 [Myxococcales bacterium]|nr:hypothetical protein [Myxococcales bacterium]
MSFAERSILVAAVIASVGCSACSQPSAPDASADSGADVRDATPPRDVIVRDAPPGEVQWFDEGDLCEPLPEPWVLSTGPTRCGTDCTDVPLNSAQQSDDTRYVAGEVLTFSFDFPSEFREASRQSWVLAPSREDFRASRRSVCPTDHVLASRVPLTGAARTAVLCESVRDQWSIVIVDEEQRRFCVRAQGRRMTNLYRRSGGLYRVANAWAWHENFERLKDDVVILEDGASSVRRLTECGCVRTLHAYNDRLYFHETNWDAGGSSLVVSEPPYRTVRTLWTTPIGARRANTDVMDPAHMVFEVSRGDDVSANRGDIYFADLRTIDTVPPRNLTNDAPSQFWPVILGNRVMFVDISRSTLNPNGSISDLHDNWDLVVMDMNTGTRRTIRSTTADGFSPMLWTPLGVYLGLNGTFAVMPVPP